MKKIILFVFFCLALNGFAYTQTFRAELAKIRTITLLESTRDDLKKILTGYKSDEEDGKTKTKKEPVYNETFSSKIAEVEIDYTEGDCSDESVWNLPAGRVKTIEISPEKTIKFADFKMEFSNLRKEQMYANDEDRFVYHNKNLGVAFHVDDGEIEKIRLLPTISFYSKLCNDKENEEAEEFKKYLNSESYFLEPKLEKRVFTYHDTPPMILSLDLSKREIISGCKNNSSEKNDEISVETVATDPENDVLTYNYKVSAGKIIGKGSKVIWDLSDAPIGQYTITATIDDGCGVCTDPKTKSVVIKRCEES